MDHRISAKGIKLCEQIRTGIYETNWENFDPGYLLGGDKNFGIGRGNEPEGIEQVGTCSLCRHILPISQSATSHDGGRQHVDWVAHRHQHTFLLGEVPSASARWRLATMSIKGQAW